MSKFVFDKDCMETSLEISNRWFCCFNSQIRFFLKIRRLSFQYIYKFKRLEISVWFRVKEGISNYELNIHLLPFSVLLEKFINYRLQKVWK